MNKKTAKLIKRAAVASGIPSRFLKKEYNRLSSSERAVAKEDFRNATRQ